MNSSIELIGELSAVCNAVKSSIKIPDSLRSRILDKISAAPADAPNGIVLNISSFEFTETDKALDSSDIITIRFVKLLLPLLLIVGLLMGALPGAKAATNPLLTPETDSTNLSVTALPTSPQQILPPGAEAFNANGEDFTNVTWKVAAGYELLGGIGGASLAYLQGDADLWTLPSFDIGLGVNGALSASGSGLYSIEATPELIKNLSNFQIVGKVGIGGNFESNVGVTGSFGVDINYNLTQGIGAGFLGSANTFTYAGAGIKATAVKFNFNNLQKVVTIYVGYAF